MNSEIYLYIYALAWIIELVIYCWKTKSIGIGGVLIITYAFSSLTSIFFFDNMEVLLKEGDDLAPAPLIYLFVCLNICMLPIIIYSKKLGSLRLKLDNYSILYMFVVICLPLIVEARENAYKYTLLPCLLIVRILNNIVINTILFYVQMSVNKSHKYLLLSSIFLYTLLCYLKV